MNDSALMQAMNRLAKWRLLFTGWQLGTRAKGDPEGDAVRDHREVTILMRAELSALVAVLIQQGTSEHGLTFDRDAIPWMKDWLP